MVATAESSAAVKTQFSHVFFFSQDIPALPKQRHFPGMDPLVAILEQPLLTNPGNGHRLISQSGQL